MTRNTCGRHPDLHLVCAAPADLTIGHGSLLFRATSQAPTALAFVMLTNRFGIVKPKRSGPAVLGRARGPGRADWSAADDHDVGLEEAARKSAVDSR